MHLRIKRDAQIVLAGSSLIVAIYRSLPPGSYTSDLQADYLPALAFRDGLDIFTPLTELSARYFPVATTNFPHPSPHPPIMTLLALPLTILPIEVLVPAWLVVNVALLVVVGRKLGLSPLASLAVAAWPPAFYLLSIGQWELVVLTLAMIGWQSARGGRDWRAGALFGLAALVKLYPALLVLPFLLRGRLRVVASAALVFLGAQLASIPLIGLHDFVRYWTEVFPAGSSYYTALGLNSSPYGALLRLFGGAQDIAPIWPLPGIVLPITVLMSVGALVAMRWLRPEAAPLALLVAMPNVWGWYPVLGLPQIVYLWRQPRYRTGVVIATIAASVNLMEVLSVAPVVLVLTLLGPNAGAAVVVLGCIQALGCVGLLAISLLPAARPPAQETLAVPSADPVGLAAPLARDG